MQLNVLQLKRSLYITFMLYSSKIWWDFSFYQKTKFLFNSKQFFSPPSTKLIYTMFIRKVFGSVKISYFDRHEKKQWGGCEEGIFYGSNILLCFIFVGLKRAELNITVYHYLLKKLLRFILFYLKNARANNVLV